MQPQQPEPFTLAEIESLKSLFDDTLHRRLFATLEALHRCSRHDVVLTCRKCASSKGGRNRKLTAEQRSTIARAAAKARWRKAQ